MDLKLNGKKALITGASQGIGKEVAKLFAQEGVELRLTARNMKNLERVKQEIANISNVKVKLYSFDLTQQGACELLGKAVIDVDILVNNAGAIPSGNLIQVDEKSWRQGWELKVMGYINLCRIFYGKMKDKGAGVIINNIGNAGEVFDPQYIAGTTGNASLMAFTRALGGTSLQDNIRVVGVNPGPVNTDRIFKLLKKRAKHELGDESQYPKLLTRYPLGRPAHIFEVSSLIVFLASPLSGYTTGVVFTVDGGIASRNSII